MSAQWSDYNDSWNEGIHGPGGIKGGAPGADPTLEPGGYLTSEQPPGAPTAQNPGGIGDVGIGQKPMLDPMRMQPTDMGGGYGAAQPGALGSAQNPGRLGTETLPGGQPNGGAPPAGIVGFSGGPGSLATESTPGGQPGANGQSPPSGIVGFSGDGSGGAGSAPGSTNTASGLPTGSQVTSTAPLPLQAFGGIPQVNPTYGTAANAQAPNTPNAAMMTPSYMDSTQQGYATTDLTQQGYLTGNASQQGYAATNAALVDPQQSQQYLQEYERLTAGALAPQFQQQQSQLQDSLSARGISHSGAAGELEGNLRGQQSAAYAAAISPMVQQGYGYSQADIAANQGNRQQANLANQGTQQQSITNNAQLQQQMQMANLGYGNAAQSNNAQMAQQTKFANQGAANQAFAANAGYAQQAKAANMQATNQASGANQAAINAMLSQGFSYQEATALANQQAQNQMTGANMNAANAATATNAGYYNEALTGNAASYNEYLARLYGTGSSTANSQLAAYLNSFGPNSGVTSAMNTGLAGTQNAYTNVYNQASAGQAQSLQALGMAAGAGA